MRRIGTAIGLPGGLREGRWAMALALLALLGALAAAPARAGALEAHTVTFLAEETAEEAFTLPAGIQGLSATAVGGTGAAGSGCSGASGGRGGSGERLQAGLPGAPATVRVRFIPGGAGGASDGAENSYGCSGGAGGGGSLLEAGESLLLAAGGGGGGGAALGNFGPQGGAGGAAGEGAGGTGEAASGPGGGFERHYTAGGEGATLLGPGLGPGPAGTGDEGGSAQGTAAAGGGGGGSGYFGGAASETVPYTGSEGQPEFGGAGGGGAASSYIAPSPATSAGTYASGEGAEQEIVLAYEGGPQVQPPEALILSPADHTYVAYRSSAATSFECRERPNGPGISLCRDSNGTRAAHDASAPTAGQLQTGTLGEFTYSVDARSKSGKSTEGELHYTVAEVPTAQIAEPTGEYFALDQAVSTKFACSESKSGTTLASCDDSQGQTTVSGGSAALETSTPGRHTFTVTARSADGLSSIATIAYFVSPGRELTLFTSAGCSEFTVPGGVVTVFGEAVGVHGDPGGPSLLQRHGRVAEGGDGGVAGGVLEVDPGQHLQVCVAQSGGSGGATEYGGEGGDGGGFSGIAPLPAGFASPLLVAGGGGGAGGSTDGAIGGRGGEAGEAGANGSHESEQTGASGGAVGAGSGSSGGEGGFGLSLSGGGGGGGGGFPAGGGGAGGLQTPFPAFSGGGGAGGTSFCAGTCALSTVGSERAAIVAISYQPGRSCSSIVGSGHFDAPEHAGGEVSDELAATPRRTGWLQVELEGHSGQYVRLSKFESAVCGGSAEEAIFRGAGQAYLSGRPGYELSFSLRQTVAAHRTRNYLTLRVSSAGHTVYALEEAELTPSVERFH